MAAFLPGIRRKLQRFSHWDMIAHSAYLWRAGSRCLRLLGRGGLAMRALGLSRDCRIGTNGFAVVDSLCSPHSARESKSLFLGWRTASSMSWVTDAARHNRSGSAPAKPQTDRVAA